MLTWTWNRSPEGPALSSTLSPCTTDRSDNAYKLEDIRSIAYRAASRPLSLYAVRTPFTEFPVP